MIILPGYKICIITPPHTGSRHLHQALCNSTFGGIYCVGRNPENVTDHHFVETISEYIDYTRVLVTRNPYGRAIGLYLHHQWASENQPDTLKSPNLSWEEFIKCLAEDDHTKLSWLYRYSITRLTENQNFDKVIKYEDLNNEINKLLGHRVDIPVPYHGPHNLVDWYLKEGTAEQICVWGYADIRKYNYPIQEVMKAQLI